MKSRFIKACRCSPSVFKIKDEDFEKIGKELLNYDLDMDFGNQDDDSEALEKLSGLMGTDEWKEKSAQMAGRYMLDRLRERSFPDHPIGVREFAFFSVPEVQAFIEGVQLVNDPSIYVDTWVVEVNTKTPMPAVRFVVIVHDTDLDPDETDLVNDGDGDGTWVRLVPGGTTQVSIK